MGHMVPVITTQLCHCSMKAATDNTQTKMCGCAPIKLYLQKLVASWIWPTGLSFTI